MRSLSAILVISTIFTQVLGQFPNTQYGNPPAQREFGSPDFFSRGSARAFDSFGGGGYSSPDSGFGRGQSGAATRGQFQSSRFDQEEEEESPESQINGNSANGNTNSPKVHKFISVHIAPPEEPSKRPNSSSKKPAQKPDTHYQIVFIKAPSANGPDGQEIELPPLPQTKTLVYVLLKKPQLGDLLKLKNQPTPKPTPPEVFFIRYKGKEEGKGEGQNQGQKDKNSSPEGGYSNDEFENANENEISGGNQYGSPFRK